MSRRRLAPCRKGVVEVRRTMREEKTRKKRNALGGDRSGVRRTAASGHRGPPGSRRRRRHRCPAHSPSLLPPCDAGARGEVVCDAVPLVWTMASTSLMSLPWVYNREGGGPDPS